jgi:hypothetical protein
MQIGQDELSERNPMEFLKTFSREFAKFGEESQKVILGKVGGVGSTKLSKAVAQVGIGVEASQGFTKADVEFADAVGSAKIDISKGAKSFWTRMLRATIDAYDKVPSALIVATGPLTAPANLAMKYFAGKVKSEQEKKSQIDVELARVAKAGGREFVVFKEPENENVKDIQEPTRINPKRFEQPLTELQQIGAEIKTARDPVAEKMLRYQRVIADSTKATADAVKQGGAQFP